MTIGEPVHLADHDLVAKGGSKDGGVELEELGDALDRLATLEPRLAELVDLHFFCGFTFAEIADARGISTRTVHRDWRKARLLLQHVLLSDSEAHLR